MSRPDEPLVCDACEDLYDQGCPHGYWLCVQCSGRCSECRDDQRADDAESLRERLRERWGR